MLKMVQKIILAAVLVLSQMQMPASMLFAAGDNLIKNPSLEMATAGVPDNWGHGDWGDNTATLSYSGDSHSGSHSLEVSMASRTSGDAKWMHDPVAVSPNREYSYSSWYKSTAITEIDLQYIMSDGSYSYAFVKIVPQASQWTVLNASFTTPANVSAVVVMHIIAEPGMLLIDDVSLTDGTVIEPTPDPDPTPDPTPEPTPDPSPVPDPDPVDNDNMIANHSFEDGTTAPNDWYNNSWGTNAASFTYEQTGRTGSRSVTTRLSSISSGDAKWYAAPVDVVAGKTYQYSDYLRANIPSRVVAAFIGSDGSYSYKELASAPASTDWVKYSSSFVIPSTAVQVSIFHVIDSVGYLTIDDVALVVAAPASTSSLLQNPSLEIADGTDPAGWIKSDWGANSPTYAYATDGRTGSRSIKVTMNGYQSGDAKWYFEPISLTPGQQYRFTTWFKGNVTPHPVAMYLMEDGSERYFGMPIPSVQASSTTWQQYSDTFSVPTGAARVSVFMYINENGWIQTDDYRIDSYHPNGFDRPLLTLTFDDGHEDNADTALPLLNQYGFKTTQCYATTYIENRPQAIIDGIRAFSNSGHEICSHTVTHPFMTQISTSQVNYELSHSKAYLEQLTGQSVTNFATPYGDYDLGVISEIQKYYGAHRSVDEGYNSKDNFNIYNLRVQNILDTTTAGEVAAWIANAQADNTWLILVYHRVADDPGPYDSYNADFAAQLQAIANSGITVKTLQAALDEVTGQL